MKSSRSRYSDTDPGPSLVRVLAPSQRTCCIAVTVTAPEQRLRQRPLRSRPDWSAEERAPSFTQAFDVKPNRLSHLIGTLVGRGTGCDNTREVGTVGRVVGRLTAFNHDQIAAHVCPPFEDSSVLPVSFLSPACLKMLASVLGCSSSLGFPATVTTPGFVGCRYCRCDPRVRV
jgi:hypothetical protein